MKTTPPAPASARPPGRNVRLVLACCLLVWGGASAHASTAYGSINNFDTVNDTGQECHGFEIEIEDLHSRDISYTYDWNHYGTPQISEDASNPVHPKVVVRYASAKNPDGSWAAHTVIPTGPIAPTDGHMFTDPSVNFGGEHFGVGFLGVPGNISYFWLVDGGSGTLVRGPAVSIATPVFTYQAPGVGVPAQVQAVIAAPPALPVKEFGPASWVKEIRTTTHNNREVRLRDLVSDDPDNAHDKNWRNGEPDEVEVEWQLLQEEFSQDHGGANGELGGAPEALGHEDEVVTRRYEFYQYAGPFDLETGEAMAENVAVDGIHGVGVKIINDVTVNLANVEVVGDYIGAQMSAFDAAPDVGLIEHVQDGEVNEPYPDRTIVIPGELPFAATNWGDLPPGMTFNRVSGQLSGTPQTAGVYNFTVEAKSSTNPPVQKNYTLTVAESGLALPPRTTVDTAVLPVGAGTATGDGSYDLETETTVTATPANGYVFARWTENGNEVSTDAAYAFTSTVNRSLVANFVVAGPPLAFSLPQPGQLLFTWPTNDSGYLLQRSADLGMTNWVTVTNVPAVIGGRQQILITPLSGPGAFFRLIKP